MQDGQPSLLTPGTAVCVAAAVEAGGFPRNPSSSGPLSAVSGGLVRYSQDALRVVVQLHLLTRSVACGFSFSPILTSPRHCPAP